MSTLTATPTATSLSISGTTSKSGTISWTCPSVPEGCTITSCILTGTPSFSMKRGSATVSVNGTTVTNGTEFTIDLGTSNTTTSVSTTGVGNNSKASGTITFTSLSYTVTYQEAVAETTNGTILIGTSEVETVYFGTIAIGKIYIGDILIYTR